MPIYIVFIVNLLLIKINLVMAIKKKITKQSTNSDVISSLNGRMPPQSVDVEVAVLGAIILEKDAYSRISDILKPESFYVPRHEIIYESIVDLSVRQIAIDIATVADDLKKKQKLEEIGGVAYLAELTSKVLSASNIEFHANILAEKFLSRSLISFSSDVLKEAYEDTEDIKVQMQNAEAKLFEISQHNMTSHFEPIHSILKRTLEEINASANNDGGLSGLPTGYDGIDKMTSGWQNSDLIIIAARPAMGKTAFVVSMAKNMALDYKIPVALFNLEMSSEQLTKRLLSNVCDIDGTKIKNGQLSSSEWERLNKGVGELESAELYIDDTAALSVFELTSKARKLVKDRGVKLIIIDYLQLMNASGMGFGNREQEVSIISRSLKVLAKNLKIPIIALSQLNRGVENRGTDASSKRPQLSDLRESGAIEQDADIVCFIHRPEYYRITEDPNTGEDLRGIGEFIIAKHRNGPIGDVRLRFKADYAKFTPLDSPVKHMGARIGRSFSSDNSTTDFNEDKPF